jgi:hypothetical protein
METVVTVSFLFGGMGFAMWSFSNLFILLGDEDTKKRAHDAKMSTIPVFLMAILFFLWGKM